jgi:hypothetical protein
MGSQAAKHKILFRGEVAEERARRDQAFGTQVLEAHRFVAVGEEPVKRRRLDYEKYDIDKHDDGSVLISTVLTERFTGAIEGTGRADHIRVVHTDGTGISTGIERIEGSAAPGRSSSQRTAEITAGTASPVHGQFNPDPAPPTDVGVPTTNSSTGSNREIRLLQGKMRCVEDPLGSDAR